jgi:uncharacterized phage infection (PIP) family protein YhgE
VLAIAILSGFAAVWQARLLRSQTIQIEELRSENNSLHKRIDEQNAPPPSQPLTVSPAPALPSRPAAPATAAETVADTEQRASRLYESLEQSKADVARLQALNADLQSRLETGDQESRRLSAGADQAKKALADAQQTIDTIKAEQKSDLERISQLETANAKLKEGSASDRQTAAQLNQNLSDLEEVFRRREMYLSNILRRYREITEQYRALSGVMDSRRDRESTPVSGPEISRIQNAIALSEEDMKQVHGLSVQAQRLEKKMSTK